MRELTANLSNAANRRDYVQKLVEQLNDDLNFHGDDSGYASHDLHSFPAKFPPQLPRKFIEALTDPDDVVLDPMVGSGTTVVEAYLTGRQGIGFDIDPLAIILSRVKTTPLDTERVAIIGTEILEAARHALDEKRDQLQAELAERYDRPTYNFIDYWFARHTQLELQALINEIQELEDDELRTFFQLVFSSIIITKSGGISLAFDLAHTRPHRAKIVKMPDGEILVGHELAGSNSRRVKLLTKTVRPALREFEKRLQRSLDSLLAFDPTRTKPTVQFGDAQNMTLADASVDLIVTSPPYAGNAIDYMRAHKFSLVWLGYPINELGEKRKEYVGGEALSDVEFLTLPKLPARIVADVCERDERRGKVVHRYYSEMTRTLKEMHRVLRPGRAAVIVVGTSIIQGVDILIGDCLAAIGEELGFEVPHIGYRDLDRDRRMLPASSKKHDRTQQIQQRMHDEYVIGFYKPL